MANSFRHRLKRSSAVNRLKRSSAVRRASVAHLLPRAAALDTGNALRFGRDAPRFAERLWIDPASVVMHSTRLRRAASAQVLDGDWDQPVGELASVVPYRELELHWGEGLSWEEVGAVARYERAFLANPKKPQHGRTTMDEIHALLADWDDLFRTVCATRMLLSRHELGLPVFRGYDDIVVHFSRSGEPLFGWRGKHRLAAGRIAGIRWIPVQVGAVHREAVTSWHRNGVRSLRRPSFAVD